MLQVKYFSFSPVQENTYVLYNEKGDACIIDPGCYTASEQKMLDGFIKENGLKPVLLLNTHCHLDHVFGLDWAAGKYQLKPHIHELEQKMLKLAPASGQMWGLPFHGYEGPLEFLKEGETLLLGEDEFSLLFTPGHSPGHLCFYCKKQGFVIGGDVLFQGSIGRTDLPMGNFDQLISSIRSQLFTLPDDTVVYPGHGPKTTIGFEKKHNPYLQ
jgi:glyoxylase-like metal-dependent hydrolase (beta-lactamase superfamily II)